MQRSEYFLQPVLSTFVAFPSISDTMYILCQKSKKEDSEDYHYKCLSTSFAVDSFENSYCLTCAHRCLDSDRNPIDNLYLVSSLVYSSSDGRCLEESNTKAIPVILVLFDPNMDWAVLRRTDGENFSRVLKFCDEEYLSGIVNNESIAKLYYYPLENFIENCLSVLFPISSPFLPILHVTQNHILLPHGVASAPSGGVVINCSGKVVGVHVGTWNSAVSSKDSASSATSSATQNVECILDSTDSCANAHLSFTTVIIPQRQKKLMNAISH